VENRGQTTIVIDKNLRWMELRPVMPSDVDELGHALSQLLDGPRYMFDGNDC
jgi:hypothetical protein